LCAFDERAEGEEPMNLITRMRSLLRDESAQDLLEYALLTALIALAAVAAIRAAGVSVQGVFTSISTAIAGALPA
jgi:pilus assembly protein Flp/PilA